MFDFNAVTSILPTVIFDTVLPTVDSVSDFTLILRWYAIGHIKFATAMLIPYLMNVCFNAYQWWKWDSSFEKKFTWILLPFQLWPIYRAIKLVVHLCMKKPNAQEEKRMFEEKIVSLEPFLESAPSLFVLFLATATTITFAGYPGNNPQNYETLIGDSAYLFWTKFLISLVTSSIGISKYFLKGPSRVLPNHGCLNGMLTCKYLMAFMSTLFSLSGKLCQAMFIFRVPFQMGNGTWAMGNQTQYVHVHNNFQFSSNDSKIEPSVNLTTPTDKVGQIYLLRYILHILR